MRPVLIVSVLLVIAAIGVGHVVKPDWFIARSGVRKGGELLTAWNRLGFRVVGIVFAGFALYLLGQIFLDYLGAK